MKKLTDCNLNTLHVTNLTFEDKGDVGKNLVVEYAVFNNEDTNNGLRGIAQKRWPDRVDKKLFDLLQAIEDFIAEDFTSAKAAEKEEDKEEKDGITDRRSVPGIQGFGPQLGDAKSSPKQL